MGYMRHHAILVTGMDDRIAEARTAAIGLLGGRAPVSEALPTVTNFFRSFFVGPDGSKEGWEASDDGDKARARFIEWLRKDGRFDWAEVQYGDDDYDNRMLSASGRSADSDWPAT